MLVFLLGTFTGFSSTTDQADNSNIVSSFVVDYDVGDFNVVDNYLGDEDITTKKIKSVITVNSYNLFQPEAKTNSIEVLLPDIEEPTLDTIKETPKTSSNAIFIVPDINNVNLETYRRARDSLRC